MLALRATTQHALRRSFASATPKIGMVGLGAMGKGMAANLAKAGASITVWDMSAAAVDEAVGNGCAAAPDAAAAVAGAEVVFTSLPRSSDVEALSETLLAAGALASGMVWVDTTSGVPDVSQRIAKALAATGVEFLDCGVAGGPAGAAAGKLSAMVGGEAAALAAAEPCMAHCMAKIVHVGPAGAGHAVKSVNNTLLAANIITAYEGLLVLARLGVPMEKALAAINAASGRSLVTEERIPDHVLSREFDFGFALDLMRKDIGITMDTLDALELEHAPTLRQVAATFAEGEAALGAKAEHMEVLKVIEEKAGATIKASD